jgi:hypothetical protein
MPECLFGIRKGTRSMKRAAVCLAVLVLLLSAATAYADESGGGYTINWWTIDGGGVASTGGDFSLSSTAGQPDAGLLSGGGYTLQGGYWFASAASQPLYLPIMFHG